MPLPGHLMFDWGEPAQQSGARKESEESGGQTASQVRPQSDVAFDVEGEVEKELSELLKRYAEGKLNLKQLKEKIVELEQRHQVEVKLDEDALKKIEKYRSLGYAIKYKPEEKRFTMTPPPGLFKLEEEIPEGYDYVLIPERGLFEVVDRDEGLIREVKNAAKLKPSGKILYLMSIDATKVKELAGDEGYVEVQGTPWIVTTEGELYARLDILPREGLIQQLQLANAATTLSQPQAVKEITHPQLAHQLEEAQKELAEFLAGFVPGYGIYKSITTPDLPLSLIHI